MSQSRNNHYVPQWHQEGFFEPDIRIIFRDDGTSYHYLPGSIFAEAPDRPLIDRVERAGRKLANITLHRGATWTTDAPYRETEAAIAHAHDLGALAVEMEAAALYAYDKR